MPAVAVPAKRQLESFGMKSVAADPAVISS
jgi:hypothetical protein